jgi:DNA-3-methyladenine glycosylase
LNLRARLARPAPEAARHLLGALVTAGGVTVRLTEVEAYGGVGADPASHAHRGRTPRNAVMFGPPGFAYVYFVFGMHWCLNVVVEPAGRAAAVLLRAGEVVDGVDLARQRRGSGVAARDLARGPARLTAALGVDKAADGTSLVDGTGPIVLSLPRLRPSASRPAAAEAGAARAVGEAGAVLSGPRVGVVGGADTPWRFWLAGEPTVSAYRPHAPRRRSTRLAARRLTGEVEPAP